MSRNDDIDHDDEDTPEKDDATLRETVSKVESKGEKDPLDDMPMTVSEDGTVTLGADARGEKTAKVGDDDEDEEHDPTLTDPEREALRAKRREEKRRRRDAARQRENDLRGQNAALKQELSTLAQRLQQVEQRTSSIDMARVDEELQGAAYAYKQWEAELQNAVAQSDGVRVTAAMQKMNAAQSEGQRLYKIKEDATRAAVAPPQRSVPPEVLARVDKLRKVHTWYDPAKRDRDTLIALAVDEEIGKEGYNPGTDEFWDELDNRLRDVLPKRYEKLDDDEPTRKPAAPQRRVPAAGGGNTTGGTANTITLSKERVQALKDAGMWNDPKKRESAIKNFIKYDRDNKGR